MDERARGPLGRFMGSLSTLLATVLGIGRTRLELFAVEVQLELRRLAGLLLWGFIAACASFMALLAGGLFIIIAFWDSHRVLAAGLVAGVYVAGALIAVLVLRAKIRSKPPMFQGTLAELARDSERLGGGAS